MMEKEEKRKKEGREGGWEDDDGRTIFALPYYAALAAESHRSCGG